MCADIITNFHSKSNMQASNKEGTAKNTWKILIYGKGKKMEQNTNGNTNWRELFSLYRDLVGPFKEFEEQAYNKRAIERETSDAKATIGYGYKKVIRQAFRRTIIWAIPFLIVFYITPIGVIAYLFELMLEAIEVMFFKGDFNVAMEIVAGLTAAVLFPCLLVLFPSMIAGGMISRTRKISKAKTTLNTCNDLLPQAETAVQEAWKKIAPYVKNIPPSYRNSSALAFFSNSFFNYKVRNLQEAVNLYDQYLHQQRMEQSQREMVEAQRESMEAINALSNQIEDLQDQINSMETVNYYY